MQESRIADIHRQRLQHPVVYGGIRYEGDPIEDGCDCSSGPFVLASDYRKLLDLYNGLLKEKENAVSEREIEQSSEQERQDGDFGREASETGSSNRLECRW